MSSAVAERLKTNDKLKEDTCDMGEMLWSGFSLGPHTAIMFWANYCHQVWTSIMRTLGWGGNATTKRRRMAYWGVVFDGFRPAR